MNISESSLEWIRSAENDYTAVIELMKLYKKPAEIIAYHCQQTIEKYLKAILVQEGQPVPFIHDLYKLNLLCGAFLPNLSPLNELCERLTPYGTATRYPGGSMTVDVEKMPTIIHWTEQIRDIIRSYFQL